MLPPVRAALSSTADYQSQAQTAITPSRVTVPSNAAPAQAESDAILSNARLDAASLSAQLKLAHGSSILAETIGKLLKMPRRENETLIDYTTRLFEAVQALKPQEIANVERLLNQIVKGISLRLMAEILKEPSGPTAARLAAHMEAANINQRDLAAKTVVSLYRQNASADAPMNSNAPRMPQNSSPAAAQRPQTGQLGQAPAPVASADDQVSVLRQPVTNDTPLKVAEGQSQRPAASQTFSTPMPAAVKPDRSEQAQAPMAGAVRQADTVPLQAVSSRPNPVSNDVAAATRPTTAQPALPGIPQPGVERAEAHRTQPGPAAVVGNQPRIVADGDARQTIAAKPHEMQALARTAVEMFKLDMPVPARLWSALSDQTLIKLANWLATVLSELDLPETAHMPATSPASQTAADDPSIAQQRPTGGQSTPASAQSAPTAPVVHGEAPDKAGIAAAISRGDTAEQQMATMAGAAAAPPTQPREALPWPYVAAYPPAEDEPRQEHRKAEPIEAIEDEEQDGSTQQQAFDDEQQDEQPQDDADDEEIAGETMTKAEKAAGYRAGEARIEADAPEARPTDLYWRMAGWN